VYLNAFFIVFLLFKAFIWIGGQKGVKISYDGYCKRGCFLLTGEFSKAILAATPFSTLKYFYNYTGWHG